MISYFTLAFKKYAEFNGRSTRSEYWYFVLANFILSIILSFFSDTISIIYGLIIIIPSLALGVRRLHDIGKSGWNILWGLLPIIGMIYLIILYCRKSQEVGNVYGPNPWVSTAPSPEMPNAATSVSPSSEVPQNPAQQ